MNYKKNIEFTPVESKRAYEAVFEQIEDMILSGKLKPNDKLPSERKLMQIYQRSHPTIREALRMLESTGYITVIPGDSSVVCYSNTTTMKESLDELLSFKKVSIKDIYNFMASTEPEFILLALKNRTWEDMIELETILTSMNNCIKSKTEYLSKMINFHRKAMQSTHNPLVYVIWETIIEYLNEDLLTTIENSIVINDIISLQEYHIQLLQAIHDKNNESALKYIDMCWAGWSLKSEDIKE